MPNPVRFSEVKSTKPSMRVRDVTISNSTAGGGLGPTEVTGFWNTVNVPPSGYIVYENKPVNGPSIMVYYNKEDTVERLYLMFPQALSNIYDLPEYARLPFAVSYANTQNGVLVVNKDFPDVPLIGLVCNVDPTFLMSYPRTGNTINDISGDGDNDGTLVDVGWSAEIDGCLILNGTTSYIDLGSGPDFDFGTNDFSISVWFRMDSSPIDSSPVILGKGTTGATGIVMYVLDNAIAVNIDNSNGLYDLKSTSTINDNDWHNIVVIRKGDVYQLIVDTYEEVNITLTGKTVTTKDTMLVGKYGDNTKYFDGKIGPIQIYNRALYARIAPPTTNLQNYFENGTDPSGDPIPESIVDWDTRNVTRTYGTFNNATEFNLDISGWDTSSVTSMELMFYDAISFNQPIGDWDVSNVTNMNRMFHNAESFNQPIGDWDVTDTNLYWMFGNASSFNQDIGNWNVSGATNFFRMFQSATNFNNGGSPSISAWTTSNVTSMADMFSYSSFNQPIGSWDVSNVGSMRAMFRECPFNQDISGWDTSNVNDMQYMFCGEFYDDRTPHPFNQDISGWNTSNVTNMSNMFYNAPFFNYNIGGWDTGKVESTRYMFYNTDYNFDLGNWNMSANTDMAFMFNLNNSFNQDIGSWDVSNVISMYRMFSGSESFNNGGSPSISAWTPSSVTNMGDMFINATNFNQPIGNWDVSSVTTMSQMFFRASSFNQPLNDWNTSSLQNMLSTFNEATNFNQDIGNWDVSNVTTMQNTFRNSQFNNGGSPSISAWTTSNVTSLRSTFESSNFNQPIGGWDVSNVTDMFRTFRSTPFNHSLANWVISGVTNMGSMLQTSSLSTDNYSDTLIGWASQAPNIQTGVSLDTYAKYNAYAQEAHDLLTGTYGWTITDGGLDEDIVMSGMVFSVDAANTTSYVSGSTTWYDLVGDNDGTLINGTSFDTNGDGTLVFDGSDDYVDFGSFDLTQVSTAITLSIWIKTPTNINTGHIFGNGGGWNAGGFIMFNYLNRLRFEIQGDGKKAIDSPTVTYNDEWKNWVGTWSYGNNMKLYLNGTLVNQTSGINSISTNEATGYLRMGSKGSSPNNPGVGTTPMDFELSISHIYNRQLSESEILQNYNAQKGRYGL